ncbi:MAG: RluA family pseudouridine synthase [Christensenellales bacterium]
MNIIYEDNHLIVVVKPQNVPSQKDESGDKDMQTMVKEYLKQTYNKKGEAYVGLLHRLDRPTGGLMVFAKTSKCASRMTEAIKNGELEKKYLTVVVGKPKYETDYLVNYLKKDAKLNKVTVVPQLEEGAKKAELTYRVLQSTDKLSLVECKLITGRSHQIRVQMATIGHPVFGDVKYKGDVAKGWNLALWSYKLCFEHPVSHKIMNFVCYPQQDETPWNYFDFTKISNI